MKHSFTGLIGFVVAALLASGAAVAKDTYTKGYIKKDGTYVQGHRKTAPNNTERDNYGTKGNTNPYTGKQGTKTPKK